MGAPQSRCFGHSSASEQLSRIVAASGGVVWCDGQALGHNLMTVWRARRTKVRYTSSLRMLHSSGREKAAFRFSPQNSLVGFRKRSVGFKHQNYLVSFMVWIKLQNVTSFRCCVFSYKVETHE